MSTTLSIIIVSYNTKYFLSECLQSVFKTVQEARFEVVVVDNASEDGSVEMMKKDFPEIRLIENKKNEGFAKANNIGIKHAKGEYLLFLNSDTVVEKSTIEKMLQFMREHPKAGAATCLLRLTNGAIDDACHRGFPTPWRSLCHFSGLSQIFPKSLFFNGYHLGYKNIDKVHEIEALAGAFMLVRKEAGEEVGWWDEDYFFYGEDIDFCYKLKEKGWKIYFVPQVRTLHYKGISSGIKKLSQEKTTADLKIKKFITQQRFSAMKTFYKKHYAHTYPRFLTSLVFLGIDLKLWSSSRKYK